MGTHMLREMDRVKKLVGALSDKVVDSVHQAVNAFERRDASLAYRIIEQDINIDHMEVDIEEECLKILALHQPVAHDLRFLVSVIKINNELERIADLAVNLAERAIFLDKYKLADKPAFNIVRMAELAQGMLRKALDALFNDNTRLAFEVREMDDEVDEMHRQMYDFFKDEIRAHPEKVDYLIHYLSA
ncbi:MAG: phosphate signaling complex protein PhoU, partial [Nitrospinae bacterium]|nr:phosphate signaling complex protein PhoU [Nitrospinota bacterium]